MTITVANAENELAFALARDNDRLIFDKASLSSQVAGGFTSLWRAAGFPGQGTIPAAAAACNSTVTGAMRFTNEVGGKENYLAWAYYVAGNAGQAMEIHDRLINMGGLSGTSTSLQVVNADFNVQTVNAVRIGDSNYMDVQWWLEWYSNTGTTAVNCNCNVTYDDGSGGVVTVNIPASTAASRMIPILPAVAGRGIRAVSSITLSGTTGTTGSFGVTATRHRCALENDVANKGKNHSWAMLGLPRIGDDSCLFGIMPMLGTTSGTARGQIKMAKA